MPVSNCHSILHCALWLVLQQEPCPRQRAADSLPAERSSWHLVPENLNTSLACLSQLGSASWESELSVEASLIADVWHFLALIRGRVAVCIQSVVGYICSKMSGVENKNTVGTLSAQEHYIFLNRENNENDRNWQPQHYQYYFWIKISTLFGICLWLNKPLLQLGWVKQGTRGACNQVRTDDEWRVCEILVKC